MKTKQKLSPHLLLILSLYLFLIYSCEKNDANNNLGKESPNVLVDTRDGTTYKAVIIGDQVWMAENLNYYTDSGSWEYEYFSSYASSYGRLYDWKTASEACPSGWHLPSDEEWKQLETEIGMSLSEADSTLWRGTDEGLKLKTSKSWNCNDNGTNEHSFSALPGGYYAYNNFYAEGYQAYFWSSTSYSDSSYAWMRMLSYNNTELFRGGFGKNDRISVRCVRDIKANEKEVNAVFDTSNSSYNPTQVHALESKWVLLGFNYNDTDVKLRVPPPCEAKEMTIAFSESNRISGNSSCNSFSSSYVKGKNDSIQIANIWTTKGYCRKDSVMFWEENYYEGLKNAKTFDIKGDTLVINSSSGFNLLFRFEAGNE